MKIPLCEIPECRNQAEWRVYNTPPKEINVCLIHFLTPKGGN